MDKIWQGRVLEAMTNNSNFSRFKNVCGQIMATNWVNSTQALIQTSPRSSRRASKESLASSSRWSLVSKGTFRTTSVIKRKMNVLKYCWIDMCAKDLTGFNMQFNNQWMQLKISMKLGKSWELECWPGIWQVSSPVQTWMSLESSCLNLRPKSFP